MSTNPPTPVDVLCLKHLYMYMYYQAESAFVMSSLFRCECGTCRSLPQHVAFLRHNLLAHTRTCSNSSRSCYLLSNVILITRHVTCWITNNRALYQYENLRCAMFLDSYKYWCALTCTRHMIFGHFC